MDTIDIRQTVAELLKTGLTQAELAALVPCSQSAIAGLLSGARGKRVSFDLGSNLRRLHDQRCTNKHSP